MVAPTFLNSTDTFIIPLAPVSVILLDSSTLARCPASHCDSSPTTRSRGTHWSRFLAHGSSPNKADTNYSSASPNSQLRRNHSLKSRAAKKIRLQLDDGIPLVIKYGWSGQSYALEDCAFLFVLRVNRAASNADFTSCSFCKQLTTGRSSSSDSAMPRRLTVSRPTKRQSYFCNRQY